MTRLKYEDRGNGLVSCYKDGSNSLRHHLKNEFLSEFIEPFGFIYKITNLENDKIYIGQTTWDIIYRFRQHVKDSRKKIVKYHFGNALKKYGEESFEVECL